MSENATAAQMRENKMGVMPVNKLLLTMSIPMIISMLVQALYNIVDSIWVSYINQDALTAVGLSFPLQNLMMSVALGTGVGINALLSKSLGEKNQKLVNQTAANGIFLELISALIPSSGKGPRPKIRIGSSTILIIAPKACVIIL